MRKSKLESLSPTSFLKKHRSFQIMLAIALVYAVFLLFCEFPFLFSSSSSSSSSTGAATATANDPLRSEEEIEERSSPVRPSRLIKSSVSSPSSPSNSSASPSPPPPPPPASPRSPSSRRKRRPQYISALEFNEFSFDRTAQNLSELHKSAKEAFDIGRKLMRELRTFSSPPTSTSNNQTKEEETKCPNSMMLTGAEFKEKGNVMVIPCGLTLGSHITLVAKPYPAHPEYDPKIAIMMEGDQPVMVSQFMMELQGLNAVDGEDPPRILHFNPRLKGDWSNRPVIEQNTCYRMQWGTALRCEGWKSRADEETVDGLVKCEKWIRDDDDRSEESKTTWWLNRLIGRTKTMPFDWPFPFVEDKLFVLTLSAGLEGYHFNVDGRHLTSFPYRTGFVLEDATGLSLNGDLEVHSIFAASLPTSHPSFAPQKSLEMLAEWQAPPLPNGPVQLFIGILSAGNHFAERMAVRKSWMSAVRKSTNLVARFFVAMHARKEVNVELKKEAEFFGDIVIVPYMDSYDLVVLKTVAICEYGVRAVSAKYVMKCDDDTFVRIDSVMKEIKKVPSGASLYVGNINYYHKPLRYGKWAVTYEEWPEEDYPPYANGPGYIVSSDIANFVTSEFGNHTLRLFKMEDVSMGMWVEQFNNTRPVKYVHNLRFCQFGCIDDYFTAHYQSPRQMICMWEKLMEGKPECCNMR